MRIVLLGYGKMGKAIEETALGRNHKIAGKIDIDNRDELNQINRETADVAIEFSQPIAAYENIGWALDQQIPVVSGTTGWLDKWEEISAYCDQKNGTLFYASNYSIGVNVFFLLNKFLAGLIDPDNYRISLEEVHHVEKKDAPSGTAITLAEGIMEKIPTINKWVNELTEDSSLLDIVSRRENAVPGIHTVTYASQEDTLEIKHTAHSRKGFALGAVIAAEWIQDKKGILGMDDLLSLEEPK